MLGLIPLWAKAAAAAAILAALAGIYAWQVHIQRNVGRAEVRALWDADIAQRTAAALQASEAARAKEQELQTKSQRIARDYQTEKARRVAADSLAADSLRRLQTAISAGSDTAAPDTAAAAGVDDDPRNSIVAECSSALLALDRAARSLAGQTIALQNYTAGVCLGSR